ncbi:MAG TPA: bifunctional 4-hydroxy-2-oxoglutarate aldolase/2-dehydro-3-deoxy-phosphogluconate aldolase [Steroidobacteraceae bacterium]
MRQSVSIETYLRLSPVIPVVTVDDATAAPDLARALVRGGIRIMEVTLGNPEALPAIEAIARAEPDMSVGAAMVLSMSDLHTAATAGASFATSPGSTAALLAAANLATIPYLPGIATVSELMSGLAAGFHCFKFFPTAAAGGTAMLRTLAGPFPDAQFCPTGGITQETVRSYLELPNVLCTSGSWLAPPDALAARDWVRIEALASKAVAVELREAP